jgi:hypothetical protein
MRVGAPDERVYLRPPLLKEAPTANPLEVLGLGKGAEQTKQNAALGGFFVVPQFGHAVAILFLTS